MIKYKTSEEIRMKNLDFYHNNIKNDPEKVKKKNENYKRWYRNNRSKGKKPRVKTPFITFTTGSFWLFKD